MSSLEVGKKRIDSLDQFRGYTVLAMFLVNFVGSYAASHWLLRHHNVFCSFADTIMPQFLFAVGFAFRLTFSRRIESSGASVAYLRVVRRLLGLVLLSLILYTPGARAANWEELTTMGTWEVLRGPLKSTWFQTLMHIAVTSLWILPVVRAGSFARFAFLLGSAGLHVFLSHQFYFHWVQDGQPNGIDGGPLGFLTWCIPMLVGTFACDLVSQQPDNRLLRRLLFWSVLLMAAGYAFSCGTRFYDVPAGAAAAETKLAARPVVPTPEQVDRAREQLAQGHVWQLLAEPPFVPPPHPNDNIGQSYRLRSWNYWMMSQRAGTLSYQTFSAGFSLAVFALFFVCCDLHGWQLAIFRTFGTNALAAYIVHMMVASAVQPFLPRDAPGWYLWSGLALYLGITYLVVRNLERNEIYLKL